MNSIAILEAAFTALDAGSEVPTSLISVIDGVLEVPAPAGDPTAITAQADVYRRAASTCAQVTNDNATVKTAYLPAAWRGKAAETAAQALGAIGHQTSDLHDAFTTGYRTLDTYGDNLRTSQERDAHGSSLLTAARAGLEQLEHAQFIDASFPARYGSVLSAIRNIAVSGCYNRLSAAKLATGAAADTTHTLKEWTTRALAQQIRVPGIDALTAVTMAYQSSNNTLNPTILERAAQLLDAMSREDREDFEALAAHAESVDETDYLWKAISAGWPAKKVATFDAVIHPYGNNPDWLRQHLSPSVGSYRGQLVVGYENNGRILRFSQGNQNDCTTTSVTMARLAMDPVLMLGVTTGRGPAAVGGAPAGDDSINAAEARLQTLFTQDYNYGKKADDVKFLGVPVGPIVHAVDGGRITSKGQVATANHLLEPVTGSTYEYQSLGNTADRQSALPRVEAAVSKGDPVLLNVKGSSSHQVTIENYRNGEFEAYDPATGDVESFSARQFTSGQLTVFSDDTDGGTPAPTAVELPTTDAADDGGT